MRRGFTLVELLVVIGVLGILMAVVLVAVNPGRQFASARDAERRSDLYTITNAVYQYAAEHNGNVPTIITATPTDIGTDPGLIDLASVLVPAYVSDIPKDPSTGTPADTHYMIYNNATTGQVVATASSELNPGKVISVVR